MKRLFFQILADFWLIRAIMYRFALGESAKAPHYPIHEIKKPESLRDLLINKYIYCLSNWQKYAKKAR